MKRNWTTVGLTALMFLLVLGQTAPAGAHSAGKLQLANVRAGSYELSVWTDPDPATVELPVHISTLVLVPAEEGATDQEFVTDATVTLVASGPDGREVRSDTYFEDPDEQLFYEGDLVLATAGDWDIEVQVAGPAGPASATFTVEVQGPDTNWLLIGLAGLGLALVAGFVFWRQGRRPAEPLAAA